MWKNVLGRYGLTPFRNVEYIFPTQQRDVAELIGQWKAVDAVHKIVIFGSSVTSACNPWSDIDVYVELDSEVNLKRPHFEVPIDLWTNFDVDDRLLAEINETGVLVYER